MGLGVSSPLFLLALLLLPLIVWIERRHWSEHAGWRRRAVLVCRVAEVFLLVLAIAGLRLERESDDVSVIFAIDASRSIPEEARQEALAKITAAGDAMKPGDRAGLLVFGRDPLIESIPQQGLNVEILQSQPNADFTDIASMLRLATGIFPEGARRRLVLFSDGNENRGQALESVRSVQAGDVQIDVFPIEVPHRNEVSITRVDLPSRVEKDDPFELRVDVESTGAGPATLRFFRDGSTLGRRDVELKPGRNQFSITFTEDNPGFHTYEATIESLADMQPENNLGGGFTLVSGPSRVLFVGAEEDNAALANALELSRLPHDIAGDLPATLAGMQPYDAIFLNNVTAADFSPDQLEKLESYVRDLGGGLGMIGGENGFGPGGWIGTPVERALPVNMELKTREKFPSLALVMVIDKSGSMGGTSGNFSKMQLASRAAVEAIDLLGARDQAGVVGFDSAAKWVARLGPLENKNAIIRDVKSMVPGGGTDAYQGALMAYEALVKTEAKLKHIILLTDGHTSPADFDNLVARMSDAGITISTIAIGTDADQAFMEQLANKGRGRFYYCPDPQRVPRIFVRETILVQRSYITEESVNPTVGANHPILSDPVLTSMPQLHGWVVTEPKSRAEQVLNIKSDPLLAVWQYGLGKSLAFTSDAKARWARDWTGWGGYASFWDRAIRWSLRGVPSTELHPHLSFDRGAGRLRVDAAMADGTRLNMLDLKARIVRPDLSVDEVPLRQTAIGVYEAEFAADDAGAYLAGIFDGAGRQSSAGGLVSYSPEFKDFQANDYLLYELARRTGGKVNPTIDEIFRREGNPVRVSKEISMTLLAIALCLLVLEVALRRLYFDEEQIAAARAYLGRLVPRFAPAGGPSMGVPGALKSRSASVKQRLRKAQAAEGAQTIEGSEATHAVEPAGAMRENRGQAETSAAGAPPPHTAASPRPPAYAPYSAKPPQAAPEMKPSEADTLAALKRRREKTADAKPADAKPEPRTEVKSAPAAQSPPASSTTSPPPKPPAPELPKSPTAPPASKKESEWAEEAPENVSKLLDRKRKRKSD